MKKFNILGEFSSFYAVGSLTLVSLVYSIILPGVMISALGPKAYGVWLVSVGLASVVSFFDLGITNVISVEGQKMIHSRRENMLGDFLKRISRQFNIQMLIIEAVFLCAVLSLSLIGGDIKSEVALLSIVMSGSALVTALFSMPLAKLRISSQFSKSQYVLAFSKLVESIAAIGIVISSKSMFSCALIILFVRVTTLCALVLFTKDLFKSKKFCLVVSGENYLRLFGPLKGNLYSSGGNWMRNQGANLAFAQVFGYESAGIFGILRTYASAFRQVIDTILIASTPKLSEKMAQGRTRDTKNLVVIVWMSTLILAVAYLVFTFVFGNALLLIWAGVESSEQVAPLVLFLFLQILDVIFLIPLGIRAAFNQHLPLSRIYLFATIISNLLALFLGMHFAQSGFLFGLFLFNIVVVFLALFDQKKLIFQF